MEPHKELPGAEEFRPPVDSGAEAYFRRAREFVERFYPTELENFQKVKLEEVTVERFFIEYVWVVHATGFSAKVVGKMVERLLKAYGHPFDLARKEQAEAIGPVLKVCNNPQKAKAVHQASKIVRDGVDAFGWEKYREHFLSDPVKLGELPYIGKITRYHLARNIGLLEFVKPDLHLVRMAEHWGYPGAVEMCEAVRPEGMPLGIVDLILWYAASTFGTLDMRKDGQR
jgi:thermostable 8-oxoguanine DNA glycosylase